MTSCHTPHFFHHTYFFSPHFLFIHWYSLLVYIFHNRFIHHFVYSHIQILFINQLLCKCVTMNRTVLYTFHFQKLGTSIFSHYLPSSYQALLVVPLVNECSWPQQMCSRACYTNDFSCTIQIYFFTSPIPNKGLLQNFVHVMTVELWFDFIDMNGLTTKFNFQSDVNWE